MKKKLKTSRKAKIVMKSVLRKGKLNKKRRTGKNAKKVLKYVR